MKEKRRPDKASTVEAEMYVFQRTVEAAVSVLFSAPC